MSLGRILRDALSRQVLAYICFLFIGAAVAGSIVIVLLASNLRSTDEQIVLAMLVGAPLLFGSILAGMLGFVATILRRNDPFLWALSAVSLGMPIGYWLLEGATVLGAASEDYYVGSSAIIILVVSSWRLIELWRERRRKPGKPVV